MIFIFFYQLYKGNQKIFAFFAEFCRFRKNRLFGLAIVNATEELAGWCKTDHGAILRASFKVKFGAV